VSEPSLADVVHEAVEKARADEAEHPEAETGECQCYDCNGDHSCRFCLAVETC
jgi:hypothetical protein